MVVCKHCGTEIENGLKYCPNCGQSIEDNFGDFFAADEGLEEEAYNIFDEPEDFDLDSLLSREFESGLTGAIRSASESYAEGTSYEEPEGLPLFDLFHTEEELEELTLDETESAMPEFPVEELIPEDLVSEELFPKELNMEEPAPVQEEFPAAEQDDIAELLGLFGGEETSQIQELSAESGTEGITLPTVDESDFFALDDLFEDLDPSSVQEVSENSGIADPGIEELFTATTSEEPAKIIGKDKKKKKEKRSLFKKVFGNVPIDPSKVKPEPTPEQIAAKKQKEEEEKKAKAEAKKLAAEEKKQIAQREKEEKARQKALAKEEKKARKLEEAKQILEDMKDTRINRVGATIVFIFFVVCAVGIFFGSDLFGYTVSIQSAESNFNKAYNNNVKYYTEAYNDIYGLDIKPEDRVLNDKIMTVMFVNRELNSYNSYMRMKDYQSALHSLLLGLYRYGKFYEQAIPLGVDRDMDYVRIHILKALEENFKVSEDEAELLRSMLESAGAGGMKANINADAARLYNLKLYEIVKESGLENDSNN